MKLKTIIIIVLILIVITLIHFNIIDISKLAVAIQNPPTSVSHGGFGVG